MNEAKKPENQRLLLTLRNIVGKKYFNRTAQNRTLPQRFRAQEQVMAIAVVFPTTLLEQWHVFKRVLKLTKLF
ncbi:hypothetical protein MASR2M36_35220 [Providencia sp.]